MYLSASMDMAWARHGYGRDMGFTHKKWSIGYYTTWDVTYIDVSGYHSLSVCLAASRCSGLGNSYIDRPCSLLEIIRSRNSEVNEYAHYSLIKSGSSSRPLSLSGNLWLIFRGVFICLVVWLLAHGLSKAIQNGGQRSELKMGLMKIKHLHSLKQENMLFLKVISSLRVATTSID